MLHQSKDELQKLCDVRMRFRRFSVACCCDIQEMFMQYGINKNNRDFLKTLGFDNHDIDGNIVAYRFKRLPFGLNCSMSMADYCLKKTASDNHTGASTKTINIIKYCFYVDDLLVSCKTLKEGKALAEEVVDLLKSGGFEVGKFLPNSTKTLESLDCNKLIHDVESKKISMEDNQDCKVLGIQWNPKDNTLSPKVDIKPKPNNKRDLWATFAQIFGPIAICAPYTVC